MVVPKLRFKSYTNDWTTQKLGTVCTFSKGKDLSKADLSDEGKSCILYGELYTKYGAIIDDVYSKTKKESDSLVKANKFDILIPSSGETAIDIACASSLDIDSILIGGDLNILTPNENIYGHFLSYQINGKRKEKLSTLAQGATVTHLYADSIQKLECYFPSFDEQKSIANFIYTMDKKIQLQQEKIDLLKEQKKGVMRKVFNQELRFKNENGENFPDWTTIPTGELGEIVTGTTPNTKEKSYYHNGGYPWVTPTDIIQKNIHITARKLTEIGISNGRLLPKNTILVTCIASIGKNAILKEVGSCNQQINAIICNKNYYYEYVYYLMEINKEKLHSLAGQGTMPIVNKETFSKMLINVACLEEQKKIGELLSTIDKKIAKQEIYLKELNNQKQAFIQQMFI